jgi:hypothetical protein
MDTLETAIAHELEVARAARESGSTTLAWVALERAHILAQRRPWAHLRVHLIMLWVALTSLDMVELIGQVGRTTLAYPSSRWGFAPLGNPGSTRVSAFVPMPIPNDLAAILSKAEQGLLAKPATQTIYQQ